MDKKDIAEFFDRLAGQWDCNTVRNEDVINIILEKGGIKKGVKVLDVACGTGVLFPDYYSRGADVTGIDISARMVKAAKIKFPDAEIICGDAESFTFPEKYGAVMIYNAFPHFANPEKLFENLSSALADNGRLSVAHGMSEKALEECHSGSAKNVSLPLPSKEILADMLSVLFDVDIMISDENMYMVSGVKKQKNS